MSESRASYFREYRAKRCGQSSRGRFDAVPIGVLPGRFVGRKTRLTSLRCLSHAGTVRAWLCGKMVARSLSPPEIRCSMPGVENVLVAASRPQAGIVLGVCASRAGGVARLPLAH